MRQRCLWFAARCSGGAKRRPAVAITSLYAMHKVASSQPLRECTGITTPAPAETAVKTKPAACPVLWLSTPARPSADSSPPNVAAKVHFVMGALNCRWFPLLPPLSRTHQLVHLPLWSEVHKTPAQLRLRAKPCVTPVNCWPSFTIPKTSLNLHGFLKLISLDGSGSTLAYLSF